MAVGLQQSDNKKEEIMLLHKYDLIFLKLLSFLSYH